MESSHRWQDQNSTLDGAVPVGGRQKVRARRKDASQGKGWSAGGYRNRKEIVIPLHPFDYALPWHSHFGYCRSNLLELYL
jgi:hypothetical protein